jgi:hypothetical protein
MISYETMWVTCHLETPGAQIRCNNSTDTQKLSLGLHIVDILAYTGIILFRHRIAFIKVFN